MSAGSEKDVLTKVCKFCGLEKSKEGGFYKHKAMVDGYVNVCKDCQKQRQRGISNPLPIPLASSTKKEKGAAVKLCGGCKIEKSVEDFPKCSRAKDKLYYLCKLCSVQKASDSRKKQIEMNPEKAEKLREKRREESRLRKEADPEKIRVYQAEYRSKRYRDEKNPEFRAKILEQAAEYRAKKKKLGEESQSPPTEP